MKSRLDFLKEKIEEMRSTETKDSDGKRTTVGGIASEDASSLKVENSAIALINTVLAMRQRWNETAQPRVESFKENYPDVGTLEDLDGLIGSMSEKEFCEKVLGFRIKKTQFPRYIMLKELVEAFTTYQREGSFNDDWEAIQDWAKKVDIRNLENDIIGKIKGIGLATVQNLRLICGIDTVKPDVHVKEALKEIGLGNEVEVVELLSELTDYSCRELDQIFWHWDKAI